VQDYVDSAEKIWVTGGTADDIILSTSVFLTPEGLSDGPDLPMPLTQHCKARINE